jgi:hypothetical protein
MPITVTWVAAAQQRGAKKRDRRSGRLVEPAIELGPLRREGLLGAVLHP